MAKIKLFVGTGCSGESFLPLEDQCVSSMKEQQSQFYGQVASCIVESGIWLLYNGDDYSHGATILSEGTYDDLGKIQGGNMHSSTSLCSIRPLPQPSAATIVLFQDTTFCGDSVVLNQDCADLGATGAHTGLCGQGAVSFGVSSAIVLSGKWTLFDKAQFGGDSQVVFHKDTSYVRPGQSVTGVYPSLEHNDSVKSAQITEVHLTDRPSWMTSLPSTLKLSQLTIPGTHDSGSVRDIDRISQCQDLSGSEQLNAGIRFFDLRLRLSGGNLEVYHGPTDEGTSFQAWLNMFAFFLHFQPGECAIVSIDSVGDPDPADFANAVRSAITFPGTEYPLPFYINNRIPTLGEVRGCLVLMRRFTSADSDFGLACADGWTHTSTPFTITLGGSDQVIGQDDYDLAKMPDPNIDYKWNLVQAQLNRASGDQDPNHLYVNFVSGAGDILSLGLPWPVAVALGSKFLESFSSSYEGMNYRLMDALATNPPSGRLGVLAMDFPNKPDALIQTIINLNFAGARAAQ